MRRDAPSCTDHIDIVLRQMTHLSHSSEWLQWMSSADSHQCKRMPCPTTYIYTCAVLLCFQSAHGLLCEHICMQQFEPMA